MFLALGILEEKKKAWIIVIPKLKNWNKVHLISFLLSAGISKDYLITIANLFPQHPDDNFNTENTSS